MIVVKIKQRGDRPNWYLYWATAKGPQWETTKFPIADYHDFSKVREIEVLRGKKQTELNLGIYSSKKVSPRISFSEVVEKYRTDPILAVASKQSFKDNIEPKLRKLERVFGNILITDMTKERVANWFVSARHIVKDDRGKDLHTNAWNQIEYKGHLSRIFRFAVGKGLVTHNPVDEIQIANPKFFPRPPRGRVVHLDNDAYAALMEAINTLAKEFKFSRFPMPVFRDILLFREFTGTRIYEALDLQAQDVLANGFIHIKASKTEDSRNIPATPVVAEILKKYVPKKKPEDFIFTWRGRHLKAANLRAPFDRVRKLAAKKVPSLKDLHFYDFRHVTLTRLAAAGVGESQIAKIAGHRSTRTTRIYINLADSDLTDAMKTLEAYRQPSTDPGEKAGTWPNLGHGQKNRH